MTVVESAAAAGTTGSPSARAWLAVMSVALGAFVIVTSEFIPVGFLPSIASSLDISLGAGGLMVLVPGLSAAIASPLIFVRAGQVDRRRMIAGLGGLVVLSNGVAAVAPDFPVVLVGRLLLGVAIAGFWTVVTPVGPKLAGARRGSRATSFIVAGVSAGTVVGLPAGEVLGNLLGWRLTFAVVAVIAAAVVITQWALLPPIASDEQTRARNLVEVFKNPFAVAAMIATAIAFIGQFAASTFITPFLVQRAHMGDGMVTGLFFAYGAAGIAGTLLGGPLVARSRVATFVLAAAGTGLAVLALPTFATAKVAVAAAVVAWGLIWGLIPLTAQVWMLHAMPSAQEASSAVNISNMQISIAIGSAVGGLLVDRTGLAPVYVAGGAVLLAAALFAAIAGSRTQHIRPRPEPKT
jgi:predicted MFS family arabinose efflux permease